MSIFYIFDDVLGTLLKENLLHVISKSFKISVNSVCQYINQLLLVALQQGINKAWPVMITFYVHVFSEWLLDNRSV